MIQTEIIIYLLNAWPYPPMENSHQIMPGGVGSLLAEQLAVALKERRAQIIRQVMNALQYRLPLAQLVAIQRRFAPYRTSWGIPWIGVITVRYVLYGRDVDRQMLRRPIFNGC
ncbi:hypothetical protein, partial [Serratia marcescens]|uniref:hypothetical protein n=1 Tax=Serratia marcescens TaxID=615 RepID=UPI002B05EEC8